ncbi:endomembrane protein 70-like [Plasmopara halstedii]|uniref:Endomembrane protein 70-like n=1 Tax=Plasmopara halstedii TaxID=4781 RepID=A0A0P1AWF2_PLAHL|nr:endomembrane protein 70-like [Plasmopara halstedii]CEG46135.1 endomembrane protein 70-like [Plasmopara halstedii]|eukprot:XP_024582504.1 endomembrane protein 70-like [Plasmopara halstedii]
MNTLEPTPFLDKERLTRWVYLAFALSTLYVVERAKRTRIPSENFFGMAASLLPTELSHEVALLHACLAGFLIKHKVPIFSHWSGAFAGLMQCINAANLLEWYKQNLLSKKVFRDAFVSSDIDPEKLKNIGAMNFKRWLTVFLPLPQPLAISLSYTAVSKVCTVTYAYVGRNKTKQLLMDVYRHQDAPHIAPIFLYIHGGGWVIAYCMNKLQGVDILNWDDMFSEHTADFWVFAEEVLYVIQAQRLIDLIRLRETNVHGDSLPAYEQELRQRIFAFWKERENMTKAMFDNIISYTDEKDETVITPLWESYQEFLNKN